MSVLHRGEQSLELEDVKSQWPEKQRELSPLHGAPSAFPPTKPLSGPHIPVMADAIFPVGKQVYPGAAHPDSSLQNARQLPVSHFSEPHSVFCEQRAVSGFPLGDNESRQK